ncbi:hypothetical protein SAMN05660862_2655 [Sphingobacterium psychroaquaticum]|uniref:Uncharacterized protein n=1 Tax=Sphingobacterium psychroaquaticum TaxID=561061 RepID=A0A1X7K9I2_9SPHI|nr:hypothetical protein SAMN05660862_2655 [Sphingobacterium psychroaquaticum]
MLTSFLTSISIVPPLRSGAKVENFTYSFQDFVGSFFGMQHNTL